jgi:hypothetical protein
MSDSSPNNFSGLWQFHSAADTLFHSRLQALMTAQSFLVTAYAITLGSALSNGTDKFNVILFYVIFLLSISVLSVFMAWQFKRALTTLKRGVLFLKREMVENPNLYGNAVLSDVYGRYLNSVGEYNYESKGSTLETNDNIGRSISVAMPSALLVFWVIAFFLSFAPIFRFTLKTC